MRLIAISSITYEFSAVTDRSLELCAPELPTQNSEEPIFAFPQWREMPYKIWSVKAWRLRYLDLRTNRDDTGNMGTERIE